jgi:hypothetical protein
MCMSGPENVNCSAVFAEFWLSRPSAERFGPWHYATGRWADRQAHGELELHIKMFFITAGIEIVRTVKIQAWTRPRSATDLRTNPAIVMMLNMLATEEGQSYCLITLTSLVCQCKRCWWGVAAFHQLVSWGFRKKIPIMRNRRSCYECMEQYWNSIRSQ